MILVLKAIGVTVAVLGGLGLIFGAVLAVASKVFAVQEDPRKAELLEVLPGANCGGCGFAGCSAYAEAVVEGSAPVGACPVGGAEAAQKMAAIMGVSAEVAARQVAMVRCSGGGSNRKLYQYEGQQSCLAASRMAGGGPLACQHGCLGFGSCVDACAYNAISIVDGCAVVNKENCVACRKCIETCPRGLITLVPYDAQIHVKCSSRAKGVDTRAVCDGGCIGCGLCAKACPNEAIKVENNVACIDYSKCTGCGACAAKCPQKIIRMETVAEQQPEQAEEAVAQ